MVGFLCTTTRIPIAMRICNVTIRCGLQFKVAVILVAVVTAAATLGGIASHYLLTNWMTQTQVDEAGRLANTLRMMVADALADGDIAAMQRGANEFLHHESVLSASVLDADGRRLAFAGRHQNDTAEAAADEPSLAMAYTRPLAGNRLLAGRPVVADDDDDGGRIVGAVRIALNIEAAAGRLHRAQIFTGLLICAFALCFLPLSHLLVSRVLIRPIQTLARITGQLAEGDYTARARATAGDEIGFLAGGFNTMAAKIDAQHRLLLGANERLEVKVRQRTAELDAANARLRADMAEREEFLRAVSHDLNAPLRNIAGMAAMTLMKWRDQLPEPVILRLQRIEANVEAETGLINELLELSRIGTRPTSPERVDVAELLIGVEASFEFELHQGKIDLRIGPDMPVLHIERNHIRQVFMNLVDNAIKYMGDRDDGRIEIRCREADGQYVFSVADNGVGIDPQDHQRIFTIFGRARETPIGAPGKGVGLASVSAIAAKCGGRAWVDSEPGAGATFHVSFDRARCEAPDPEDTDTDDDIHNEPNQAACSLVG